MIYLYLGIPGSGKTYSAVKKIAEILSKCYQLNIHRTIHTNIAGINPEAFSKNLGFNVYHKIILYDEDVLLSEIIPFMKQNDVLVVDEYHRKLDTFKQSTKENKFFLDYATYHRHYGHDIILITQTLSLGDSRIQSIVAETHYFRNLGFLGSSKKFKHEIYSGGDKTQELLGSSKIETYDTKIFDLYKSREDDTQEHEKPKFAIPLKIILMALVAFILFAVVIYNLLSGKVQNPLNTQKQTTEQKTDSTQTQQNENTNENIPNCFMLSWGDTIPCSEGQFLPKSRGDSEGSGGLPFK